MIFVTLFSSSVSHNNLNLVVFPTVVYLSTVLSLRPRTMLGIQWIFSGWISKYLKCFLLWALWWSLSTVENWTPCITFHINSTEYSSGAYVYCLPLEIVLTALWGHLSHSFWMHTQPSALVQLGQEHQQRGVWTDVGAASGWELYWYFQCGRRYSLGCCAALTLFFLSSLQSRISRKVLSADL